MSIALEELGLKYEVKKLNYPKGIKKNHGLKLNPNGRIPVLKHGKEVIFDSGAILYFLAKKYNKLIHCF